MSDTRTLSRPRAAAVIAAGGTGTRMNAGVPKQFLEIAGRPILCHTVERMAALPQVRAIVVALPAGHIPRAEALLGARARCVAGGESRQDSVLNAVRALPADIDVILVHDAVRPLCPEDLMLRVLEAAWAKGAAVPGLPATDTIGRVSRRGRLLVTPPRAELYAIQTPQGFHAALLREALERAQAEGFRGTDESSVVRRAGHAVWVVPGSPDNLKITRPPDLELAGRLLGKETERMDAPEVRVGQGIDYHRLTAGRRLVLGGVEIPFERGLEGHSDADVLLHAVCDALLGAAGMGDIGRLFPDSDPAWRGRASLFFLEEVGRLLAAEGWRALNVDATLVLERPKIAPHALAMRRNIAAALGLDEGAVGVKATTSEGMNAEGRGEGVSAQAVALIARGPAPVTG
ncbi:MAG: 2-C-methyl-D-erythritol 4-phosphate cytidylyltransferase [Acidobacteria bacterium]|nr:2-C-methyl-D-erythritol 4-phosphate cytidylyltransferase [Acidobacteriota bacterium]